MPDDTKPAELMPMDGILYVQRWLLAGRPFDAMNRAPSSAELQHVAFTALEAHRLAAELAEAREECARLREVAVNAVLDEPELPGPMPDEMWAALQTREHAAIAMQETVRATKDGILRRLLAALTPPAPEAPEKETT